MDAYDPPPPHHQEPVHSAEDLRRRWLDLLGRGGVDHRALWFMLLDAEGRVTPLVSRIEALPQRPERRMIRTIIDLVANACHGRLAGGSTAFLLARPGHARLTQSDKAWCLALQSHARLVDAELQPIFVCGDDGIVAFALPPGRAAA